MAPPIMGQFSSWCDFAVFFCVNGKKGNLVPINSAFAAVWSFSTDVSKDFEMRFESISSALKSVLTVGLSKLRCSRVIFWFKSKLYRG